MEGSLNPFKDPIIPPNKEEEGSKEEAPLPPVTPEQKVDYLEFLSELRTEVGFIETPEMIGLRDNPELWEEKAREIQDTAGTDSDLRKKLNIGTYLGSAAISYAKNEMEAYDELMVRAANIACSAKLNSLGDRIYFSDAYRKKFEDTSVAQLESLGYVLKGTENEYRIIEKNGYHIKMKHFARESAWGINNGQITDLEIEKDGKTIVWNKKGPNEEPDEETNKIYEELVQNFNFLEA